jgi:hypothetical protein
MDFDPESLVGVWTDFRLATRVIDLRTGTVRFTVDNSANYREELISWTSTGRGMILWVLIGTAGFVLVVLFWRLSVAIRRRRAAQSKR